MQSYILTYCRLIKGDSPGNLYILTLISASMVTVPQCRWTDRLPYRKIGRQTDGSHTKRQAGGRTPVPKDRQTNRQTGRQTERQADRWTDSHTERQTYRRTDSHRVRKIGRQTDGHSHRER